MIKKWQYLCSAMSPIKIVSGNPLVAKVNNDLNLLLRNSCRMAQTTKWLPAILEVHKLPGSKVVTPLRGIFNSTKQNLHIKQIYISAWNGHLIPLQAHTWVF